MSENKVRIYLVRTPSGERLVRAKTRVGAVAYVARGTLSAKLATQEDLERMFTSGRKVEELTPQEEEDDDAN